jgi:hypothetical protein
MVLSCSNDVRVLITLCSNRSTVLKRHFDKDRKYDKHFRIKRESNWTSTSKSFLNTGNKQEKFSVTGVATSEEIISIK